MLRPGTKRGPGTLLAAFWAACNSAGDMLAVEPLHSTALAGFAAIPSVAILQTAVVVDDG
jgi:hypothetical protein